MQVELLAPRTLALVGPVRAEDADGLLEAMATVGPGGPITLDLAGVSSIDEGGMAALRGLSARARDEGELLILLVPPSEALDRIREAGMDEEPLILIEVLET